jgi:hypothetical protein
MPGLWIVSPSSMICPTDKRGDREPKGSWKTTCISLRKGRICRESKPSMRWPT